MEDVSAEVAASISSAKVFGSSDNIRHGKYKFLIKRIHATKITTDRGDEKMGFWEFRVLESKPNPQVEGDRVDYVSAAQPGVGPLKDDGTKPNEVGSTCALKVNFDGPSARSAGSNIQSAILGLFGKLPGQISQEDLNKTWLDLARQKPIKKGDPVGVSNGQVVLADKDKPANWACGMVIWCETRPKKKKKPNEKGMYVTLMNWSCNGNPPGVGENAWELVNARRAEIEAQMAAEGDDDYEESTPSTPSPYGQQQQAAAQQQVVAPQPPAPPAPSIPSQGFVPPAPWRLHQQGTTPDTTWYWDGGQGMLNQTQLMAQLQAKPPAVPTIPSIPQSA
jgi:hypothetical protein